MGLFTSMAGSIRIELTSADVAASLCAINEIGIPISDVRVKDDLSACFTVSRIDVHRIQKQAERRGEQVRILARQGLFWPLFALRNRPILVFGIIFMLFLCLYLPSRVLFVSVEGNVEVPSRLILAAAQESGIRFGASRRAIRSEKMKNAILGAVPQLQWAGVNTHGCTAVITVRERAQERQIHEDVAISNIVSACDGVITSCTVTSGNGLCSAGQAVQEGQMLISGYTDLGGVTTAARAQGEVFAETRRELTAVTPSHSLIRSQRGNLQINFSLRIGKKRINFYKGSGISDGRCVKMVTEYTFALPGGYRLPVALIKETVCSSDFLVQLCNEAESEEQLSAFSKTYLQSQSVALTVLNAQEEFIVGDGRYALTGAYACVEMIGREQSEQIGDFHGKTD